MQDGFLRVAAATPEIRLADCSYNAAQISALVKEAPSDTALIVFPELCITGYTCGDLLLQPTLLHAAEQALVHLLAETADCESVLAVGLPVAVGSAIYNCAAVCQKGRLLGLVPKTHLPNYAESYEERHFSPDNGTVQTVFFAEQTVPFGAKQLFSCKTMPAFCFGVEICEDVWTPNPPSDKLATAGATVIANLSAGCESIGKSEKRRELICTQSARLSAAYLYANAGLGESTTDLVFGGHNLLAENGVLLKESAAFSTGLIYTEIDVERLLFERRRKSHFSSAEQLPTSYFDLPVRPLQLTRPFRRLPFVPEKERLNARCEEVLSIQANGLRQRLKHTGCGAILGLSGGLDSALALLVTLRAFDLLQKPHAEIHAVTMPCYGTTARTKSNALTLAEAAGCTLHEIDIHAAVTQHLQDIGHDGQPDVTYENAQARERTQVLMDLSNRLGLLVVGTGDLSELALGWATYNGDHMSMYDVNAAVPKTLLRHLVAYEADRLGDDYAVALHDILDTPVSPELLPPSDGEIAQKTEELVGPYELHDFFLYYIQRFGYPPAKVLRLATYAFGAQYDRETVLHWLQTFLKRFFSQQFKRSCMPDGPHIGSVGLSPRSGWQMPSDAVAATWQRQLEKEC